MLVTIEHGQPNGIELTITADSLGELKKQRKKSEKMRQMIESAEDQIKKSEEDRQVLLEKAQSSKALRTAVETTLAPVKAGSWLLWTGLGGMNCFVVLPLSSLQDKGHLTNSSMMKKKRARRMHCRLLLCFSRKR